MCGICHSSKAGKLQLCNACPWIHFLYHYLFECISVLSVADLNIYWPVHCVWYTVVPGLKDHSNGHKKVVCQGRWSSPSGSSTLIYSTDMQGFKVWLFKAMLYLRAYLKYSIAQKAQRCRWPYPAVLIHVNELLWHLVKNEGITTFKFC